MKKKEKAAVAPFGVWLRAQVHRTDDVGRIARRVVADEVDLRRPLRALEDRVNFAMYIRSLPRRVGIPEASGRAAWKEWCATLQQQEVR